MGKVSERWAGGERASIIFNIIIIILPSHQFSLVVFIIVVIINIIRVSERWRGCERASIASIIMIHDPNHLNPTRSCAALRAADLDWIVRPGYSLGGYIPGCSQHLELCLQH